MTGFLPDEFIDQLRDQTDIVEVIGQYVTLKKRGQNWVGLCPFHAERTPSFTVTPSRGIFKCFGCGKGGDVYSFLIEHQKMTFTQACEMLAGRLGLQLPRSSSSGKEDKVRDRLFYAVNFAKDFFHHLLLDSGEGKKGLEYLLARGLERPLIGQFELGWAPAGRDRLKKAALEHGIDEESLLGAGLLISPEEGGESYDRFRERVIFPIADTRGRAVGFGGRVLEEGQQAKYLNSPDTPLYHKGELLFGLDRARGPISKLSRALVVEGYMDLLSLYQHGVDNVVAPLGTALTGEQARLISRYAREVFLLYDADAAGLKATFRGGDALLEAGVNVRVVTLPNAKDPDEFIRKQGREAFDKLLPHAADFLDRKIELLKDKLDLELVSEREKAADKCLESVAVCRDELVRNLYLKKTVEFIGVPETVLAERLKRISAQHDTRQRRELDRSEKTEPPAGGRAELYLLALCLKDPAYLEPAVEKLGENPFGQERLAEVFDKLKSARRQGVRNLVEALYGSLPDSHYPLIAEMQEAEPMLQPPEQVFNWCWRQIKITQLKKEMKENFLKIDSNADPDVANVQAGLNRQIKQLQKDLTGAFWLPKF